ncbi:alpha/beta hydrolase [Rossellomorea vietnamensis]|uniref:Alpha/beta hydrolase n=1 Tax=Rossellomorea vietnamensis TaxID=218284 RepID=A0A5D4MC11_9BACI|nr:alpha/beta hydrolase [Rossellomorea vietnamensis]TYR98843.1 alpha/beta hydrolase [Rossellomorea vietnamensis]
MGYCDYRDRELYFEDYGEGTPILLIHPPGLGRKSFIYQNPLKEQFRLIIPDLSGHGDSYNEADYVSIETYVEEIRAILDHLSISRCVLLGYSAGGVVAQEFTYKYMDIVELLILAGGYPKVQTVRLKVMHLLGMKAIKERPQLMFSVLSKAHAKTPEAEDELYEHMEKANRSIWYHFYKQSLYYNCTDRILDLKVPLLLIYGAKSDWINNQYKLYKEHPQHELVVIENAKHQLPTLFSNSFNKAVYYYVKKMLKRE